MSINSRYIEIAWAFSTLIGLVLFLIEIAILCWVKFYDLSQAAAWSACIVLVPVLVVFVGKFHFCLQTTLLYNSRHVLLSSSF